MKKNVAEKNTSTKSSKTTKTVKTNEKVLDHKCPACAAPIHFNPKLGLWKCDYCSSEFNLEQLKKHNNASSDKNNKKKNKADDGVTYVSYSCQNCGAEVIADEQTAATFCVYCGNTAIMKNKLDGKFAPDYIIPFKVEKEEAIKAFECLSKGRPFMPKGFNDKNNIEKIKGVYIPFWLYDLTISGSVNYDGQVVKYWSTATRHYTKIDYYKIYRTGSMNFIKIPVDGSTRFDNNVMNSIEPFNFNELKEYNHAYLSGFYAERYDLESDITLGDAVNRAVESAKITMLNDAQNYANKTIFENTLRSTVDKKDYVLLPVWMVNVKYQDKYYLFAMNGQTGEFIGNVPVDSKKAWLRGISLFLGLFVGISLLLYLFFSLGGF